MQHRPASRNSTGMELLLRATAGVPKRKNAEEQSNFTTPSIKVQNFQNLCKPLQESYA